jgi:hypothetical protein
MKAILPLLLAALTVSPAFAAPAHPARPANAVTPAICPEASEQLSEYLASAKQRVGFDGEVRVEFEVDANGRAKVLALDGSRRYRSPVRIASRCKRWNASAARRSATS